MRLGTHETFTQGLEEQQERSEEHTSELQSQSNLVCRLLLEKKIHTSSGLSAFRQRASSMRSFSLGAWISLRSNRSSTCIFSLARLIHAGSNAHDTLCHVSR